MKHLINFNAPEERLVVQAIFSTPPLSAPKGFLDVFSVHEIDMMMSSDEVWNTWSQSTRDWIISAFDEIISAELALESNNN